MEFFSSLWNNHKTIILSVAAAVLTCALMVVTAYGPYRRVGSSNPDDTVILFLGDSNFVQDYGNGSIPEQLIRATGATGYICSKGGTLACDINPNDYPENIGNVFQLVNLVRMMESRNILPLKGAGRLMNTEVDQYKVLSVLDYKDVDYIFLNYGLNDYANGMGLEDDSDPYNVYTYGGAMRFAIEELKRICPNVTIVAGSITYNIYVSGGVAVDGYDYSYGGGKTYEYRDALRNVCEGYDGVAFLDNLSDFGINYDNYQEYLADNMHLNVQGQKLYVEAMKKVLEDKTESVQE